MFGAQLAADRADREIPDWSDRAYALVVEFIHTHRYGAHLTCEDVRAFADKRGLPKHDEGRAWGAVMLRAGRAKLVRNTGTVRKATDPKVHANPLTVWEVVI